MSRSIRQMCRGPLQTLLDRSRMSSFRWSKRRRSLNLETKKPRPTELPVAIGHKFLDAGQSWRLGSWFSSRLVGWSFDHLAIRYSQRFNGPLHRLMTAEPCAKTQNRRLLRSRLRIREALLRTRPAPIQ